MAQSETIVVDKPKGRLSAEEMERRRQRVRRGDAHNRIEGIIRDSATDHVFEAYIQGDIEVTDIVPRLQALRHQL